MLSLVPIKQYVTVWQVIIVHVYCHQVTVRFNTSNDIEGWSLAVLNGDEFFVTTTGIYLEV